MILLLDTDLLLDVVLEDGGGRLELGDSGHQQTRAQALACWKFLTPGGASIPDLAMIGPPGGAAIPAR